MSARADGKELALHKRMHRISKFSGVAILAASIAVISAQGGDETAPRPPERREFHLSELYPYIYRPRGYLETEGPAPMRYGAPAIDVLHRAAPALPVAAEGTPPPTPKQLADAQKKVVQEDNARADAAAAAPKNDHVEVATAAYPPPDNGPNGIPKGGADFTKAPDEVVGYFRNPYNFVPNSHRFFDPIFEPAVIQQNAQQGPQSSATYIVKP